MRLRVLILCSVLFGAIPTWAAEPQIPAARGFVNDFARVIDNQTAARLEAMIGELQAKTGSEIAIITVDSTQPLTAFDYAMRVAEQWKPGAKGKDNGVVFLVAVRDRDLFILTGYGVEGALPDGKVGEIRDQLVVPRFKAGDYSGGIRAGAEAIASIIAAEFHVTLTGVQPQRLRPRESPVIGGVPLLALILIVVLLLRSGVVVLPTSRGRRYDHWGGGFGGGGFGGSGGGFGGGGFGGFGGGGFGGGGAGGKW